MKPFLVLLTGLSAAVLVGCGSSSSSSNPPPPDSGTPSGAQITITNLTYSPADLTVDAGTVIAIINNDTTEHTVTSETADNMFTPGGVGGVSFDVTVPAATSGGGGGGYGGGGGGSAGTASLTVPANAPSGTVIPFYCRIHTSSMATPNGHLTIR